MPWSTAVNTFRSLVFSATLSLSVGMPSKAQAAHCTMQTTNISFGNYDVFNPAPVSSTGRITVSCNRTSSYTITASTGNSGNFLLRQMSFGSYRLAYNLYINNTYSTVWGNGNTGTAAIVNTAVSGTHTIFGQLPARQNVASGTYSDTLIVILSF